MSTALDEMSSAPSQQERAREALDLAPVDPDTGRLPLSVEKPPSDRQVSRLRELAEDPAFGDKREEVAEVVEEALEDGLSEAGALGLILELGGRIWERRERGARAPRPRGGTCRECGRDIGPSAIICGRCRRIRRGLALRGERR